MRNVLDPRGVEGERIYADHGLTGANRARPGVGEALAACCVGDMLVVTKHDRLAPLPGARNIADELTRREVKLNLGGSIYDPTEPIGRLPSNVLAMVAEFEADPIRMRMHGDHPVAGRRDEARRSR